MASVSSQPATIVLAAEVRRQRRGTRDPNPGTTRLSTPPSAMASPPTVTPGAAGAASGIAGGVARTPTDAVFTYSGCPADFGTVFPDTVYYSPTNIAAMDGSKRLYQAGPWAVEFDHYGQTFDLRVKGTGPTAFYRISVDALGYDSRTGRADTLINGSTYYIHYDFGSVAWRRIRFDFAPNTYFGGLIVGPTDTLTKSSRPVGPRVLVMGDSFMGGAANTQPMNVSGEMLGWLMGWRNVNISGTGGTGYVATNSGTRPTFGGRIEKDVVAWVPDVVVQTGGLNDSASSPATIQANADVIAATYAAELPTTPVILVLPFWSSGSPSNGALQARDAIVAGFAGRYALALDPLGGVLPFDGSGSHYVNTGWITGTGKVGTPAGTGNADVFTDTDGTHPTQAGHDHLAHRIAAGIAAALPL